MVEYVNELHTNHQAAQKALQTLLRGDQPTVSKQELKKLYDTYFSKPIPSPKTVEIRVPKFSIIEKTISESTLQKFRKPLNKTKRDDVVLEGYLHKKGAQRRNWTTRWFVCTSVAMMYFKRPEDTKPKGIISLQDCTISNSLRKENCFTINTGDRTYFFVALDAQDKVRWMNSIKEIIRRHNPPPLPPPKVKLPSFHAVLENTLVSPRSQNQYR